ncbi:hypothetical protein FA95DRAFT_1344274 [Auriscalpium vulgare]|uniref:Uncharacterized protein n=1 Tax=Auriscalpium vulgare TaxID=40419 RepID=A0ACB8RS64_9AGAM|nr:hypothetical protein FA95DRAFT_1344274 [Auriscalpium vulgare]
MAHQLDRATDRMRALLRTDPSAVIGYARHGLVPSLQALALDSEVLTTAQRIETADAFCAHLLAPPQGGRASDTAGACLIGLTGVLQTDATQYVPAISRAWGSIFKWINYLSESLKSAAVPAEMRTAASQTHMHIMFLLLGTEQMRQQLLATPGLVAFMVERWMALDHTVLPQFPIVTLALELLARLRPATLDDLVAHAQGDVDAVALHALAPMRLALKLRPSPTLALQLRTYAMLVASLSTGDDTPLQAAIMENGAMRGVTRILLRLSRMDILSDIDIKVGIDVSVRFVALLVECGIGINWLQQTVKEGFFEALLTIAPWLPELDENTRICSRRLIQDIIPRYLLFPSVITPIGKRLEGFTAEAESAIANSMLSSAWTSLKALSKERLEFKRALDHWTCETCGTGGQRKLFRRCSGCHLSFYCSRRCQSDGWVATHRDHCAWRRKHIMVQLDGLVSYGDQEFHRMLIAQDARDRADTIRAMAPPCDGLPHSIIITLDYTTGAQPKILLRQLGPAPSGQEDKEDSVQIRSAVRLGRRKTMGSVLMTSAMLFDSHNRVAQLLQNEAGRN